MYLASFPSGEHRDALGHLVPSFLQCVGSGHDWLERQRPPANATVHADGQNHPDAR